MWVYLCWWLWEEKSVFNLHHGEIYWLSRGGSFIELFSQHFIFNIIHVDSRKSSNALIKFSLTDIRTLIHHLEHSNFSTLIYVLSNGSREASNSDNPVIDTSRYVSSYCDVISSELSSLYQRNIIFWPCPRMKVSLNMQSKLMRAFIW